MSFPSTLPPRQIPVHHDPLHNERKDRGLRIAVEASVRAVKVLACIGAGSKEVGGGYNGPTDAQISARNMAPKKCVAWVTPAFYSRHMKLWRTKDGRYSAGVHIAKNEMARYFASVYLALDKNGEILTELMKTLPPTMTSQDAMRAGREWALENLPYKIEGMEIWQLRQPRLG